MIILFPVSREEWRGPGSTELESMLTLGRCSVLSSVTMVQTLTSEHSDSTLRLLSTTSTILCLVTWWYNHSLTKCFLTRISGWRKLIVSSSSIAPPVLSWSLPTSVKTWGPSSGGWSLTPDPWRHCSLAVNLECTRGMWSLDSGY